MNPVLVLESINFSYSNGNKSVPDKKGFALKDISFSVEEKDFISVIGKNGSGKSTLVKLFSKILVG
ncbi:MAG: ATP-binding cassette domain-containing protein [Ignavibacteria bacterium]|nr:ATP-binding cassette domain-containing protein [Ignavibacteria bacterium]